MADREAHQVEHVSESVNDIRSNIIYALAKLYNRLDHKGVNQVRCFENYKLTFQPGQPGLLVIDGCIDEIRVFGKRCSDVHLGSKIKSYGHIPLEWINTLEI